MSGVSVTFVVDDRITPTVERTTDDTILVFGDGRVVLSDEQALAVMRGIRATLPAHLQAGTQ